MTPSRTAVAVAVAVAAMALLGPDLAAAQEGEHLDRGLVVRRCREGADSWVYVGWRLLASDPEDVAFHVYRQTADGPFERLTSKPIADSTNYVDDLASETTKVGFAVAQPRRRR